MITEHPVVCGSGVFLFILARPDLGITIETDEPPGREKRKTAGLFPENSAAEKHGQVLVNSVEKWYTITKTYQKCLITDNPALYCAQRDTPLFGGSRCTRPDSVERDLPANKPCGLTRRVPVRAHDPGGDGRAQSRRIQNGKIQKQTQV